MICGRTTLWASKSSFMVFQASSIAYLSRRDGLALAGNVGDAAASSPRRRSSCRQSSLPWLAPACEEGLANPVHVFS